MARKLVRRFAVAGGGIIGLTLARQPWDDIPTAKVVLMERNLRSAGTKVAMIVASSTPDSTTNRVARA
jgi:hypothetical protein